MDCEKVRDQFSSLLERELSPMEERIVREHLASCFACQRELKQFEKVLHWLHSTDQVEVPEGFLSEILEKREDRKRKAPMGETGRWRWFDKALSLKLPIQAMGMVVVLFLVIYITKMMPVETPQQKSVEQGKTALLKERRVETELAQKEMKKERVAEQPPLSAPQPKSVKQTKKSIPEEKRVEGDLIREEVKGEKITAQPPLEAPLQRETEKTKTPSFSQEKIGGVLVAKKEASLASRISQEITLRISDREKTFSRFYTLVDQFGGEIISAEGNIFLASIPVGSFSEFEKELKGLSSSGKPSKITPQKDDGATAGVFSKVQKREVGERHKETSPMTDRENRIVVRIVLLEE